MELSFCFHIALRNPGLRPPLNLAGKLRRLLVDKLLSKTDFERRREVPDLPVLPLHCERRGAYSTHLQKPSASLLKSLQFDIIVNFTNYILRGEILTLPRFGVWSYHHGDPSEFRGYPPGFWEIYQAAPTTGAILQKLEERLDDGVVLRKATFPTVHHSYFLQRQQLFSITIPWMAEVAEDILRGRSPELEKSDSKAQGPIYSRASHLQLLRFLLVLLKNKATRLIRKQ